MRIVYFVQFLKRTYMTYDDVILVFLRA